ncbi:nuclear transport factor 2 family protein [Erythrobacter sp. MTPC3]|uniref:nuclear transport factor 2 family protein n=1 Tax=Erythrobacter sp. MTPC3 TaxID=3056564 RepID=UPI0036F21804
MADLLPQFEVLENQLMRAWLHRDLAGIKQSMASECITMFGTRPPALLDRPSFLAAVQGELLCEAFRFQEITARQYGKCVWFTGHVELELKLGRREWAGNFLITDLWRKTPIRRRWMLTERSLARVEDSTAMSDAIRALQLWR